MRSWTPPDGKTCDCTEAEGTQAPSSAASKAKEAGCDAVVFSRDTDGDADRIGRIEDGIESARKLLGPTPSVVGAAAPHAIEAWVLALHGVRDTEAMSKAKHPSEVERVLGPATKGHVELVDAVDSAGGFSRVPADAVNLLKWCQRARARLI